MTAELPGTWRSVPLGDVADVRSGVAKGRNDFRAPVTLPYLRVANVQDGHLDLSELKEIAVEAEQVDRYSLAVGDVLLTEGGDFDKLGRGTVWRGEVSRCLHQNHVFAVRCNRSQLYPDFLSALTSSAYGKAYFLGASKQTTNLASINSTQLKAFPVLLPPLPEQRKIAAILSAVDEVVEKTEAVIESLQALKKAMIQELLTRGLPGRHARFKQTAIGEVPEQWDVVQLGTVLLESKYGTSEKCQPQVRGTPVLRIPNVVAGRVLFADLKYAELSESDATRYALEAGDVLLIRTNGNPEYVGRTAVFPAVEGTWLYASYLIRLRLDRARLLPEFLHVALLRAETRRTMRDSIRTSAGNYNLNTDGIGATLVVLPSLDEQRALVIAVEAVDARIDCEVVQLEALRRVKSALMSVLLTGKLRVTSDEDAA